MAAVPPKVLNWLYSVLTSEYHEVNRTYSDVAHTLAQYPSLKPRTEVHTYENGTHSLLLLLSGTLPVSFRGTVYHFPIAIWVPHAYPREPPLVYVTPAQEMAIRPGQHVSGEGRVYHPYLAQWGNLWDKSTIVDFLSVLRDVFAKEPPVVARQQQFQPITRSPLVQSPPPLPPLPPEIGPSKTPVAQNHINSRDGTPRQPSGGPIPPPPPPKPSTSQYNTAQIPGLRTEVGHPPPRTDPGNQYGQPPPAVPRQRAPSNYGQGWQVGSNQGSFTSAGESPVSPITPDASTPGFYPTNGAPPTQPPYNAPGPSHQVPPSIPHSNSQMNSLQQMRPVPRQASYPYSQHPQPTPQSPLQVQRRATQPPPDLMDSPLEVSLPSKPSQPITAPPIPPNPEKDALLSALSSTLREHVTHTVSQTQSSIPSLQAQATALQNATASLQQEMSALGSLEAMLGQNEKILHEAMQEADRVMVSAKDREIPNVDEVLVAPTVVGGQLYDLVAEEAAIGDAMFVLGKALDRGRIGLDLFLRTHRGLARERFLRAALIKKISKGMGLDEGY